MEGLSRFRQGEARQTALIVLATALCWLPHAARFPPYVAAVFFTMLAARLVGEATGAVKVSRSVMVGLATLGFGWAVWSFRPFFGGLGSFALLTVMVALKLLEMRSARDRTVAVIVGYVLLGTRFLYDQTPLTALWMIALAWLYTFILAEIHNPGRGARPNARLVSTLLLYSTPVALVLFFVFPRAGGPLWTIPTGSGASTGLSEEMSAGKISSLAQSDELAFRVEFAEGMPNFAALYWRGPVLDTFDGVTWRTSGAQRMAATEPDFAPANPVKQEIILEPHGQRWMFALDMPLTAYKSANFSADFTLNSSTKVVSRRTYSALSDTRTRPGSLDKRGKSYFLRLPQNTDQRILDLAKSLKQGAESDEEFLVRSLEYFNKGGFAYSLNSPILGRDPTAEFLFESKRGFCEHFSSALAVILRAAGTPSRVVTGYLGAEENPLAGHWFVLQRQAHAWVEAWVDGAGWVRLDPTAVVSPERLRGTIDPESSLSDGLVRFDYGEEGGVWGTFSYFRMAWDGMNYRWNSFVLGYNKDFQRDFLKNVGFGGVKNLLLTAFLAFAGWFALVWSLWAWKEWKKVDPARRTWLKWQKNMQNKGIAANPSDGPFDYAQRVSQAFPHKREAAHEIAGIYAGLRYGKDKDSARLKQAVEKFGKA